MSAQPKHLENGNILIESSFEKYIYNWEKLDHKRYKSNNWYPISLLLKYQEEEKWDIKCHFSISTYSNF